MPADEVSGQQAAYVGTVLLRRVEEEYVRNGGGGGVGGNARELNYASTNEITLLSNDNLTNVRSLLHIILGSMLFCGRYIIWFSSWVKFREFPFAGERPEDDDQWPRIVRATLQRHKHYICRMCTANAELREEIFTKYKNGKYVRFIEFH